MPPSDSNSIINPENIILASYLASKNNPSPSSKLHPNYRLYILLKFCQPDPKSIKPTRIRPSSFPQLLSFRGSFDSFIPFPSVLSPPPTSSPLFRATVREADGSGLLGCLENSARKIVKNRIFPGFPCLPGHSCYGYGRGTSEEVFHRGEAVWREQQPRPRAQEVLA